MRAITGCAVVTPLGDGAGTWGAICAGRRVEGECGVAEELLEGEAGLDRSIRIGLGVARRAMGNLKSEIRDLKWGDMGLFCGTRARGRWE